MVLIYQNKRRNKVMKQWQEAKLQQLDIEETADIRTSYMGKR